jgi:hypothetical protein
MDNLEEGLYNELKNDATLAGKIKDGDIYNIYPLVIPPDTQFDKAITYQEITNTLFYPDTRTSIFQINCIADSYDEALDLSRDVNRIFDDKHEFKLGDLQPVAWTKFYGRTAIKDWDIKKFIYIVEIAIKY